MVTHSAIRQIPEMEGIVAYPRKNGEPVFEEPWQSRAFGTVVALHREGLFHWDEFKQRLIAEISSVEACGDITSYYEHWLAAFWRLLAEKGILHEAEIEARKIEFESGTRKEIY